MSIGSVLAGFKTEAAAAGLSELGFLWQLVIKAHDGDAAAVTKLTEIRDAAVVTADITFFTAILDSAVAVSGSVTGLATHTADVSAHHTRYADSEALFASVKTGVLTTGEGGTTKAPTHSSVITGIDADVSTHNGDSGAHNTEFSAKAEKTNTTVASAAVITSILNAPDQTSGYVEADVDAIATLANDLKVKYNDAVILINEIQTKIDTMNT